MGAVIFCALCLGSRHVMLSPDAPEWLRQAAEDVVRVVLAAVAVSLAAVVLWWVG